MLLFNMRNQVRNICVFRNIAQEMARILARISLVCDKTGGFQNLINDPFIIEDFFLMKD